MSHVLKVCGFDYHLSCDSLKPRLGGQLGQYLSRNKDDRLSSSMYLEFRQPLDGNHIQYQRSNVVLHHTEYENPHPVLAGMHAYTKKLLVENRDHCISSRSEQITVPSIHTEQASTKTPCHHVRDLSDRVRLMELNASRSTYVLCRSELPS